MKTLKIFFFILPLVFVGCTANISPDVLKELEKNVEPQVITQMITQVITQETAQPQKLPGFVYPNRDAKVGEKYGEMTLEKINDKDMYATFKGKVTIAGFYEYYDNEVPFTPDQVCFTVKDFSEFQKLPKSEFFYEINSAENHFCFKNNEKAKQLLGLGKGGATIVISSFDSLIDLEGEVGSLATLDTVISRMID